MEFIFVMRTSWESSKCKSKRVTLPNNTLVGFQKGLLKTNQQPFFSVFLANGVTLTIKQINRSKSNKTSALRMHRGHSSSTEIERE